MIQWQHPEIGRNQAERLLIAREKHMTKDYWKGARADFLGDLRSEYQNHGFNCYRDQPSIHEKRENGLSKVIQNTDLAWRKIQNGTWGICEECKEPISKKRLEIMPEARECIFCKTLSKIPEPARGIAEQAIFEKNWDKILFIKKSFNINLAPLISA